MTSTPETAVLGSLTEALASVLSCSREVIELAVCTMVAGGHLLLEDVPGVGKTTLARAMARGVGGTSKRIQFTPDMLPGDLTGVSVYQQTTGRFEFHPGPLFANIVIADEINRANPKTQSAMLEAMAEGQVSVDGGTYPLPDPYMVIATQNPIELEGTYALPEAQLDRFMTCASFGYPTAAAESAMVANDHTDSPLAHLEQVCSAEHIARLRAQVGRVRIAQPIADYIVALVAATRHWESVRYGASPRGSLALGAMARARAMMLGREFVLADDVQAVAAPVLAHRLVLDHGGYGTSVMERSRALIADIVAATAAPRVANA